MSKPLFNENGSDDAISELLSQCELEHDPGSSFDKVILREVRLDQHSRTLKFWMPAIAAALLAGMALLTTIEVVTTPTTKASPKITGQEAKLEKNLSIPDFRDPGGVIDSK